MTWGLLACAVGCVEEGGFSLFDETFDEDLWEPYANVETEDDEKDYAPDGWVEGETDTSHLASLDDPREDAFYGLPRAPVASCDAYEAACPATVGDVSVEWGTRVTRWEGSRLPTFWRGDDEPLVLLRFPADWEVDLEWVSWRRARAYTDAPHAGCDTLVANGYSGGAHCCSLNVVVTSCDGVTTISTLDAQHSDGLFGADFVDVDLDGRFELVTYDWSWAYFGLLSFAGSPAIPRALRWNPATGWAVAGAGADAELYAEERVRAWEDFADFAKDGDPWSLQHGSYRLALHAGSALRLAGADATVVRDEVTRALERGIHDDPANPDSYQGLAEDPAVLTDAIVERMDDFGEVRTIYRSEASPGLD
jgi:hypothetical protein